MVFNRAPAEWQVDACWVLLERVEEGLAVGAKADSHAVSHEMTLDHPVALCGYTPSGSGVKLRNPVAVANPKGRE